MSAKRWMVAAWMMAMFAGGGDLVHAQRARIVRGGQPGAGGQVNLPWMVNDNKGQMWRVYQGGYLQNQGPTPNGGNTSTFSQAAVLMINGNNPQQTTNTGRVDEKTGEMLLENLQGQGY